MELRLRILRQPERGRQSAERDRREHHRQHQAGGQCRRQHEHRQKPEPDHFEGQQRGSREERAREQGPRADVREQSVGPRGWRCRWPRCRWRGRRLRFGQAGWPRQRDCGSSHAEQPRGPRASRDAECTNEPDLGAGHARHRSERIPTVGVPEREPETGTRSCECSNQQGQRCTHGRGRHEQNGKRRHETDHVRQPEIRARPAGQRDHGAGQSRKRVSQDDAGHGDDDFRCGIRVEDPADAVANLPDDRASNREASHEAGEHEAGRPDAAAKHQSAPVKPDHLEHQARGARHEAHERQPARIARRAPVAWRDDSRASADHYLPSSR